MIFSKLRLTPGLAFAVVLVCSWASQTSPVSSQEQQQVPPPDADQAHSDPNQVPPPEQAPADQAPPAPAAGTSDTLPPSGDSSAPAAAEPSAPAPDGAAAAPSAEPPQDSGATTAAPAPGDSSAPPPADSGAAEAPAAQPEPPAATAEPAPAAATDGGQAAAITASQITIGATVFGADGAKIGEVNGVKSDDSGKLQEILVTDGVPAGMNAKVFEITADKIVSVGDGVKLSLSSEETKKLPIIDNSSG